MARLGIIDSHIHAYPGEVAEDPAGWGLAHGEPGWTACVAPEGRRSIQGWADTGRLIADMDAAGIAVAVMLGWYWQRQETCDLQNGWYQKWIRERPGRLLGFAAVQPAAGPRALEALERALDGGLCGVGEMLPQAQGYAMDDPVWRSAVEIAVMRGLPVTLHATDPSAGAAAGPRTPLGDFVALARDYPEGRFILAHWGGGLAFTGRAPDGGPLPANLYFDTAASPLLYGADAFARASAAVGPGRILYGSDYPLLLHPRKTRQPGFGGFLAEIEGSGLGEDALGRVLSSNARGVLAAGLANLGKDV